MTARPSSSQTSSSRVDAQVRGEAQVELLDDPAPEEVVHVDHEAVGLLVAGLVAERHRLEDKRDEAHRVLVVLVEAGDRAAGTACFVAGVSATPSKRPRTRSASRRTCGASCGHDEHRLQRAAEELVLDDVGREVVVAALRLGCASTGRRANSSTSSRPRMVRIRSSRGDVAVHEPAHRR